MIITGIGSRPKNLPKENGQIAPWLVELIQEIGEVAKKNNWQLRSGGAEGMDSMFEAVWGENKQIFIPWEGFNGRHDGVDGAMLIEDPMAIANAVGLVSKVHPVWKSLKKEAKNLHTRNVFQALGPEINHIPDTCIFYAPVAADGEIEGGTRTAVVICRSHNVPTYNLRNTDDAIKLRAFLTKWK